MDFWGIILFLDQSGKKDFDASVAGSAIMIFCSYVINIHVCLFADCSMHGDNVHDPVGVLADRDHRLPSSLLLHWPGQSRVLSRSVALAMLS